MIETPTWWPNIKGKVPTEVEQTIRLLFNGINDHENAIINLKGQVSAASSTTTTTVATSATSSTSSGTNTGITLGGVNNQTGTSYALLPTDNGGIVTLNNASPVAVTLTSTLTAGYFGSVENIGAGTATLTPLTGLVNGAASIPLVIGQGCFLYFDGVNWWAVTSLSPSELAYAVNLTSTTLSPGQATIGSSTLTGVPSTAICVASLYDATSPGVNEQLCAFAYNQGGNVGWSVTNVSSASATVLTSTVLNIRVLL